VLGKTRAHTARHPRGPEVNNLGMGTSPDAPEVKCVRMRPDPVADLADGVPGAPGANVVTMVVPYVIIL